MTTKCRLAEELEVCLRRSETIPGWTRGEEARELLRSSHSLSAGAVIVEIGSFFWRGRNIARQDRDGSAAPGSCIASTLLMALAILFRSTLSRILAKFSSGSLRDHFEEIFTTLVLPHGFGFTKGAPMRWRVSWTTPIDLLYLDGDQSQKGVREAYGSWGAIPEGWRDHCCS